MNTKTFIATSLLSLLAAGSVYAQSASAAGLTREEVRAELYRARAAGEIPANEVEMSSPQISNTHSDLTRAQVMAEYIRARANGEIAQNDIEYPKLPVTVSTVSRAQVKAELARARAAGEIPQNEADLDVGHHFGLRN